MGVTKLKGNALVQQHTFYEKLFSNFNKYIEIRLIDSRNQSKGQLFMTYEELLQYDTPNDVNVYVGVFERGKRRGKETDCTKTNAIYLDFDNVTLEEIMFRIDMNNMPIPSLIVNSGHGYHVYWKLDKPAGHEVKPITKKLQSILQADSKAVDIARVLRVPATTNVKEEKHVKAELIQVNDVTTSIKIFEKLLNVKAEKPAYRVVGSVQELEAIKTNGLHNMAKGVGKGERNFCTGRIVQTLKRMNFTKLEATNIVFKWNTFNKPQKDVKELKKDINTFWHDERYRYDGKTFSDERLEEINLRFIDDETVFFNGVDDDAHSYDNELLKPDTFIKTTGLTFATLSIIKLAGNDGIRREHIADLSKRNAQDKKLRESLNLLERMKYIKVIKRNRVNHYVFTEKANYKRGYTNVSKSLHRSYIHGELKEQEYKLMILLESYAYDGKKAIYPSNQTLALRSGRTERTIRNTLKQLQHKQFIKVELKHGKRYIYFIYR